MIKKRWWVVLCTIIGIGVYLNYGKPNVVFKEPSIINELTFYQPKVLWPSKKESVEAGEGSGIAVSSEGDIYYLHRASGKYSGDNIIKESTIVVLDGKTRTVKNTWGAGLFKSPHGLEIDHEDKIWITDISMNKIFKFNQDGTLLKTYGEDYPKGLEWRLRIRNVLPNFPTFINENTFARPTDLTVLKNGSFVVADGYRNHRIAKFNPDGKLEWQVNKLGNDLGEFNLPHGISSDSKGNIYVADRNNARIQIFDHRGKPITVWNHKDIGRPYGIEVGIDQKIYVVDGGDYLNGNREKLTSQVLVLNKKGEILERFGSWGNGEGQLKIPHDIAVDNKGTIYVAELLNKRLQSFDRNR